MSGDRMTHDSLQTSCPVIAEPVIVIKTQTAKPWPVTVISSHRTVTVFGNVESSHDLWQSCTVIAWTYSELMFSHYMTLTAMPSIRMNHHTLPNSYPVIAWPVTVVMKIHRLTRDSYCMTHDSLQNTYTVKTWTVSRAESSHQNACQYMEWRMHCKKNNSSELMPIHRMTRTSNCMIRDSLPNSCLRITCNIHEGLDGV